MTTVGRAELSEFCSNSTIFWYLYSVLTPSLRDVPVLLLNQLNALRKGARQIMVINL